MTKQQAIEILKRTKRDPWDLLEALDRAGAFTDGAARLEWHSDCGAVEPYDPATCDDAYKEGDSEECTVCDSPVERACQARLVRASRPVPTCSKARAIEVLNEALAKRAAEQKGKASPNFRGGVCWAIDALDRAGLFANEGPAEKLRACEARIRELEEELWALRCAPKNVARVKP